jgi:hypothetical protein
MITLTDVDKKFYSQNAPALLGYMRYVEYVIANKEKFGGEDNVVLALQIGKFIGRNDLDSGEMEQIKFGVANLCKSNKKAKKVMELLENDAKLHELVKAVIETNPKAFLIVGSKGEILLDGNGNPVPNLMKISLAIAKDLEGEL